MYTKTENALHMEKIILVRRKQLIPRKAKKLLFFLITVQY